MEGKDNHDQMTKKINKKLQDLKGVEIIKIVSESENNRLVAYIQHKVEREILNGTAVRTNQGGIVRCPHCGHIAHQKKGTVLGSVSSMQLREMEFYCPMDGHVFTIAGYKLSL
ncbi:MAG: hypothetical protein GF311_21730 [Candidatus Lokiarchaeota archaeon]|nr:hypothetical protein [Candidatus Lokiarchaeota archaeon]